MEWQKITEDNINEILVVQGILNKAILIAAKGPNGKVVYRKPTKEAYRAKLEHLAKAGDYYYLEIPEIEI